MAGQLEALRLAARQGRHRLAQLEVFKAHFGQRRERGPHFGFALKEHQGFVDGHVQHIGDRAFSDRVLDGDLEHLRAKAPAVAIGAAQIHIRQELHLNVLEAVAAAGRAAAVAGVEAEGAGGVAAFLGNGFFCKELAHRVPGADVAGRIGARRLAYGGLVDHDHLADVFGAAQLAKCARHLGRAALGFEQGGVQHVLDQCRLARTGHAGDRDQMAKRNGDIDVFEVVRAGAEQFYFRRVAFGWIGGDAGIGAFVAGKVLRGERVGVAQLRLCAEEHHIAAALARARAHVEQAVGFEHDLRVVLDHHQRVAGVAQPLHHADDAAHVARVQANGRLVQHEQRVDKGGAQRRGEVDALHLAAREGSRLAV